ncbi:MAG: hypothetical protein ACLFPL_00460 [Candidatus Nanoarchaeia archaeon]
MGIENLISPEKIIRETLGGSPFEQGYQASPSQRVPDAAKLHDGEGNYVARVRRKSTSSPELLYKDHASI